MAQNEVVTVRVIEAREEDEVYQLAAELQKLIRLATLAETTAVALRARIITQLRAEGMDGSVGGMRGFFGESSDAARTADKVVKPLAAISADLENAAKNAHVFRNRAQSLVFDAIREFRRTRERGTAGLKVN
jgi:hypothetical protein